MLTSDIGPGTLLAGDSREYRLGPVLAEGGEGVVFFVQGRDDVVAKVYKDWEYGRDTKLRALIGITSKRLRRVAAWPLSCLFDSQDKPVGFVMESLEEWTPLHAVYQIRTRLQTSPMHTWAFLVRVARNLATCVHHVHEQGLVIGDLNESNVLVGRDAMVKLIDTDSFQVRVDGQLYPCKVGKPELMAPELLASSDPGIERTPDHDRFALAALIFQILLFGRHPFAGRPDGDYDVSLEKAIANGWYVFSRRKAVPLAPPPHLTLDGLSQTVRSLFERAFDPTEPVRPSGREWFSALRELEISLRTCAINGSHVYGGGGANCPWCLLEEKWNISLFRPAPADPLSGAGFDVNEVWDRIRRLPVPRVDSPPGPINYWTVPPTPLYGWRRYLLRPMRIISVEYAFWFIYAAIIFGRVVFATGAIWKMVFLAFLAAGLVVAAYVQALRFRIRRANRRLAEIAQEWETRADAGVYEGKLSLFLYERNSLLANLERYEKARQVRIRELHQPELDRFLRKYTIMAADPGPGTDGRAKLSQLRDRGIATAADIDRNGFKNPIDVDATFWEAIVSWRTALEDQFWNSTSYSLPPHEERGVLERIHRQDVAMRRDLHNAEAELTELAQRLRLEQIELIKKAEPYQEIVRRYGSVLCALEPRRARS